MTNDGARLIGARLLLVTAVLLALPACSPTRLTDVWKDPGHPSAPFRQVAVFAFGADDAGNRLTEDDFVHRLPAVTRGAAGHGLVPPAEQGEAGRVRERLRAGGFDGVIVVWTASEGVAPGRSGAYRTFGDAYATILERAQEAGGDRRGEAARLHTFVYTVPADALVWSAASRPAKPDEVRETTAGVARNVMERLQEAGLLPAS